MNNDLSTPQTQKAWELYNETQRLIKEQGRLFLQIGFNLKLIRDKKMFRYLGEGGFDTWSQFLENAEVSFRPQTARLYIQIYELYIERLKFKEDELAGIALYRLQRLMPPLRDKSDEEARELVEEARLMTSRDFDTILREKKMIAKRPILYRCKECNKWKLDASIEQLCTDDKSYLQWLKATIDNALEAIEAQEKKDS